MSTGGHDRGEIFKIMHVSDNGDKRAVALSEPAVNALLVLHSDGRERGLKINYPFKFVARVLNRCAALLAHRVALEGNDVGRFPFLLAEIANRVQGSSCCT